MSIAALALVVAVGFAAALVGVVTGGNSLVTVPVMIAAGMAPRTAVATNMLACTFLALSGGVRFARAERPRWDLVKPLVPLTLVTSWLGARLLASLDEHVTKWVVTVSLVVMLGVFAARPGFGVAAARKVSRPRYALGLAAATVLGVYGGLYSAGYTTLLTFTCIGLLGASLTEAVGLTKVVNFASSGIAALEFARHGIVDWRVGVPLSAAMLVGAWIGAHVAVKRGHRFMRALFLVTIAGLAVKLVWDMVLR